jgi:EpsI family protein
VSQAWRLWLLLGLIGLAAAAVALVPAVSEQRPQALLFLAPTLPGWIPTEGAPEWALPPDPAERTAVRRTYERGADTVWVSVALFTGQQDPKRRVAINRIYPERNTVRIDRLPFALALNGSPSHPLGLPAVLVQRSEEQRLLVVYWHQMGGRAYGGEYAHRLALTRDIVFARRADSVLVRIAVPITAGTPPDRALRVAAEMAPALFDATRRVTAGDRS